MLKTERSREDEDDLMIWVSRVSHTGSWVHHDDDLGDGSSGLRAKYGSSNSRSLGLVNTLGVEHQRRERVRKHHLLKKVDFKEEFKDVDADAGDGDYREEKSTESESALVHHPVGRQRLQHRLW